MSRNFEMIQQAEQSRALFQSHIAPPAAPDTKAAPEQPESGPQEDVLQIQEKPFHTEPRGNGQAAVPATILKAADASSLSSWLHATIQWLGIRSNGHAHGNRGNIDYQSMAQQEEIKLVERVFLGPESGSNRVILFSGIDQADGGARVCAQAAQTLAARVQGTVCILDADLQSRSLERHLQIRTTPGLLEATLQSAPIRRYTQALSLGNLWMITCGGNGASAQAPLNSERLRVRFDELRRQFDYVLINAPSVGTIAHLAQFAQLADGVIFVVEANSTRRETTKQFKESLEELRVRVLGVVLNDRTFPIPESVYRKL